MMLLLGRLITLLLLLPKLLVKISFSLRMLLKFLIPRLIRRFVPGLMRKEKTPMLQRIKRHQATLIQRNVVVLTKTSQLTRLVNLLPRLYWDTKL
ncbi:hypothetical protein ANAPRD1_01095 [Anaplasma phagocytophilum]|nr:hypothetical protein ANAPRD1_01095 [Anaplasma phagocytophilum]